MQVVHDVFPTSERHTSLGPQRSEPIPECAILHELQLRSVEVDVHIVAPGCANLSVRASTQVHQ